MYRIGLGYDIHRLDENRDLIIGGIKIPYENGFVEEMEIGLNDISAFTGNKSTRLIGIGKNLYPLTMKSWKEVKRTLSKLMKLINSCGYDIDVAMFNDVESIEEGLQELVGSTLYLDKKTSKKGFVDYSFMNEEELAETEEEE